MCLERMRILNTFVNVCNHSLDRMLSTIGWSFPPSFSNLHVISTHWPVLQSIVTRGWGVGWSSFIGSSSSNSRDARWFSIIFSRVLFWFNSSSSISCLKRNVSPPKRGQELGQKCFFFFFKRDSCICKAKYMLYKFSSVQHKNFVFVH